jgi:small nuclear ribonucleoprotein (snRNP)-like protein
LRYFSAYVSDAVSTYSFFKTLVDHEVTVELKNDIQIRGTLKSVDQYLNIKLDDIQVVEELKYPHLVSCARYRVLGRMRADLSVCLVVRQECLYQRERGEICAPAGCGG